MRANIVAFYSSITTLNTELCGRVYGGGVLKLELGDARKILLPDLRKLPKRLLKRVATMSEALDVQIRSKVAKLDVVEDIDRLILSQGLGLSGSEIAKIVSEADRLRQRRMSR